jgi:hypothetical protein
VVSYGRDANGHLTAVLTPPAAGAASLHFSAGGRTIDAEQAVVTLTFSPDLKNVLVDPGYVGKVEVDSHLLRAHDLADDQPLPAAIPPVQTVTADPLPMMPASTDSAPSVPASPPAIAPTVETASAPVPALSAVKTVANAVPSAAPVAQPNASLSPSAPSMLASQLSPILAPMANAASSSTSPATGQPATIDPAATANVKPVKLFWSEPITAPDGSAPAVAVDEIKLVELHGSVTVVLPTGDIELGAEGLAVPSGSTIRTAEKSSVALFLGGVNSARLMPNCELVVTQTLANSVRTDVINLHHGAVFSRIGHRDGETENYSVVTPEGTSDSGARDMLAYRGTAAELRGGISTTRAGLVLDERNLLAWNPAPSHGLITTILAAISSP